MENERRQNLKPAVTVWCIEVRLSAEGMGGLNVTDIRRESIPLLSVKCILLPNMETDAKPSFGFGMASATVC